MMGGRRNSIRQPSYTNEQQEQEEDDLVDEFDIPNTDNVYDEENNMNSYDILRYVQHLFFPSEQNTNASLP